MQSALSSLKLASVECFILRFVGEGASHPNLTNGKVLAHVQRPIDLSYVVSMICEFCEIHVPQRTFDGHHVKAPEEQRWRLTPVAPWQLRLMVARRPRVKAGTTQRRRRSRAWRNVGKDEDPSEIPERKSETRFGEPSGMPRSPSPEPGQRHSEVEDPPEWIGWHDGPDLRLDKGPSGEGVVDVKVPIALLKQNKIKQEWRKILA